IRALGTRIPNIETARLWFPELPPTGNRPTANCQLATLWSTWNVGQAMITRREALKTVALTAGALTLVPSLLRADTAGAAKLTYPYKVPDLGYGYDALEPYIDTMTMQLHHDKHHAAYVSNLNKALETADPKFQQMSLEELLVGL